MIEIEAKLKKWGRSFGIIIPMENIKELNLSENESLDIRITKKKNPFIESFGKIKFKKSAKEIIKEIRKGAWDE